VLEPLYMAEEMRAAEHGHDVGELMERAGRAVADEVLRRFPDAKLVVAVCGRGANGGDGRIAARLLREAGINAGEADDPTDADVVVDALFGTGFRGELRPDAAALIEKMNTCGAPIVAVDLPSGVDASSGEVAGAAVDATATVTMHARKVGLEIAPGRFRRGDVTVADIGLQHVATRHQLVNADVLGLVPRRQPHDNKYTAGSVLVVGGSRGMTGAAALAARAAFRADAGYVAIAAPKESLQVLETLIVEAVKKPLTVAAKAATRASALAIGPGLGRGHADVVRELLATELPAVLDADALFELQPTERSSPTVLTPHEGELARLLGEESGWVAAHRLEAVQRAAVEFSCTVVLKGADSLVCGPDGAVLVVSLGPPSLAVAGTGDVLTGVLGSFLAKGLDPTLAAAAAAAAQQLAAARVVHQAGLVAGDVVEALPAVLS
jgi:ADP-dependent NAD(P)H-hydrate dehydratase / NAD(P)H-hydrate epimerase